MNLICGGVLDKYPRLRVAFLEAGGLWVPFWLARLDEFYDKIGHMVPRAKLRPSEYFRRQCFCSCEPDDVSLKAAAALGSQDYLMWASDYPHPDSTWPNSRATIERQMKSLSAGMRRKLTHDNAAQLYGLSF